ncbi:MAG: hypothetical protein KAI80_06095 [Hyphomicrobiaceae bacterium]|nr:hypothetical protein [Hyphomicrobiaceae bacterium]
MKRALLKGIGDLNEPLQLSFAKGIAQIEEALGAVDAAPRGTRTGSLRGFLSRRLLELQQRHRGASA